MVTSGGWTFCTLDADGTNSNRNRFALKPSSRGLLIILPPGDLEIPERHQSFKLCRPTTIEDITDAYCFRIFFTSVYVSIEKV